MWAIQHWFTHTLMTGCVLLLSGLQLYGSTVGSHLSEHAGTEGCSDD